VLIPVCIKRQAHNDNSMDSSQYASTLNASQCKENPGSNNLYDELIHLNMKEDSLLGVSEKLEEVTVVNKEQPISLNHTSNLQERVKEVQIYKTDDALVNYGSLTNKKNTNTQVTSRKTADNSLSNIKNTPNKQEFDNSSCKELNFKSSNKNSKIIIADNRKHIKTMKTIFIDIKYSPSNSQNIHVDIKDASEKQSSVIRTNKKLNTPLIK
jgi:hypothetical protein